MQILQDENEYAVIAHVLDSHFRSERRRLLRSMTGAAGVLVRYVDYAKFAGLPRVREPAKRTYSEEEGDWILKNKNDRRLLDGLHPRLAGYELFSQEEQTAIFGRTRDLEAAWRHFHERYPERGGLLGVSRVGFDKARQQAMIQVSSQLDGLCGFGKSFFLSRSEESWTITRTVGDWIS